MKEVKVHTHKKRTAIHSLWWRWNIFNNSISARRRETKRTTENHSSVIIQLARLTQNGQMRNRNYYSAVCGRSILNASVSFGRRFSLLAQHSRMRVLECICTFNKNALSLLSQRHCVYCGGDVKKIEQYKLSSHRFTFFFLSSSRHFFVHWMGKSTNDKWQINSQTNDINNQQFCRHFLVNVVAVTVVGSFLRCIVNIRFQ